jgi:hypothetical protein
MTETPFGFNYTWSDLKPVKILASTAFISQAIGAGFSYFSNHSPNWFESLWFGGALATLPGFLVGLLLQHMATPGRLSEHRVMVQRYGFISAALTAVALAMSYSGIRHAA